LSAYSYHSARAATPALLVLFLFDPILLFFKNNLKKYLSSIKKNTKVLVTFVLFVLLILPVFLSGQSKLVMTRFSQENVFERYFPYSPPELINEKQPYLSLLNSPYYYSMAILSGHVLAYFSPINLGTRVFHWVRGSVQYIPSFSILGWVEAIMFFFGLVYAIKKINKNFKYRFLIYWIVSAAAPAALTWNWFHPLRSMNMYMAVELIVVIGMWSLFRKIKLIKIVYLRNFIFLWQYFLC